MSLPPILQNLEMPIVAAPMFIVSGPELVIAQCKAGIVGSFPNMTRRFAANMKCQLSLRAFKRTKMSMMPRIVMAGLFFMMSWISVILRKRYLWARMAWLLLSPFALIPEIRQFFDGPLLLSGSIATGGAVAGALAIGADLAYIGTRFIASKEANAEGQCCQCWGRL